MKWNVSELSTTFLHWDTSLLLNAPENWSKFSPYSPSGKCPKKAFLWFVHTFGILEAPILYFRGNFIASASGTTVVGKGLIIKNDFQIFDVHSNAWTILYKTMLKGSGWNIRWSNYNNCSMWQKFMTLQLMVLTCHNILLSLGKPSWILLKR